MKQLWIGFALLLIPAAAVATECESEQTLSQLSEIISCKTLVACGEGKKASDMEIKDPVGFKQNVLQKAKASNIDNESVEWFTGGWADAQVASTKAIHDGFFTLTNAHAVDYKEAIARYECEVTFQADRAKLSDVGKYIAFQSIVSIPDSPSPNPNLNLISELMFKNDPKFRLLFGLYSGSVESQLQGAVGPKQLSYSVQKTDNGTLVLLESTPFQ